MERNVGQLEIRKKGNCTLLNCAHILVGKRKDETRSCEKCRHLERGTHYPMAEFIREKGLRWFGHVQRRDKDDATRKILQMTLV